MPLRLLCGHVVSFVVHSILTGPCLHLHLQLSVSVAASSTVAAADKGALERRSQAVQAFFHDKLGLSPADNTGAYLSYHIPATQGAALPDFLQELEAVGAQLGVTDLNIGLTSLEEVSSQLDLQHHFFSS